MFYYYLKWFWLPSTHEAWEVKEQGKWESTSFLILLLCCIYVTYQRQSEFF